jgi:HlyD family secretion protein
MSENSVEKKDSGSKTLPIIIGLVVLVAIGVAVKMIFFRSDFLYAGTIEVNRVDVPARVTSVISELLVKEGDRIQKGQNLLKLSCEDYRLAQNIATQDFERTERLFKAGSQPKETYDQMKNKKDEADLKVAWCSVESPLSGVVLNKYHETGEMVSPSLRLFTLANLKDDVYAYIYVAQPEIAKLKLGDRLTGYLPELNMKAFDGKIVQISDEAEFTPKNVQTREERTRLVYGIKINFENANEILKPGMTIEVKIPAVN